jgi:hypothetical protein
MSRKKKEGKMPVKKGVSGADYEPRHDGVRGTLPSRRKPAVRDSWHPEAPPIDHAFDIDGNPELSMEERELVDSITTHLNR